MPVRANAPRRRGVRLRGRGVGSASRRCDPPSAESRLRERVVRITSTRNSPWLSSTLSSLIPMNSRPSAGIPSAVVWSPMPNGSPRRRARSGRRRAPAASARSAAGRSSIRPASRCRCASSLSCTWPLALNVSRSPLRTVMPVSTQRWLAGTRMPLPVRAATAARAGRWPSIRRPGQVDALQVGRRVVAVPPPADRS